MRELRDTAQVGETRARNLQELAEFLDRCECSTVAVLRILADSEHRLIGGSGDGQRRRAVGLIRHCADQIMGTTEELRPSASIFSLMGEIRSLQASLDRFARSQVTPALDPVFTRPAPPEPYLKRPPILPRRPQMRSPR
jgi:hypothetical protein